jgi:NTE family protein
MKTLLFAALVLMLLPVTDSIAEDIVERPRIGLVLGGGGAKGGAHIGVLKVLEKYQVPVDAIAGTSMGAIIGALYASGNSAEEIEEIVRSIDWNTIFDDKTPRRLINFRRKQDDQSFLTDFKLSFRNGELVLPEGLIQGQKLFLELSDHLASAEGVASFDDLSIPFRAVAADLETGGTVVMKEGDLATAVFASMAVPGVIPPVERDGLLLVDGGIANNLPVDVARSMGVDIVIVVDVGARLRGREEIDSFLDVLNQVILMLGADNVERQLMSLSEQDILIQPELGDMTAASFDRFLSVIDLGRSATDAVANEIGALGLSEEMWHQHLADRNMGPPGTPTVDYVEIDQDSPLSDAVLAGFVRAAPGEQLDRRELREDIADLYGLDTFERITFSLRDEDGRTGLAIHATENPARRNYFRFGLLLETDFDSDTIFQIGASYTKRNVNRFGGEWRSEVAIGSDLFAGTEFYQPFGSRLKYFVNPIAAVRRGNSLLFEDSSTPTAEISVRAAELGLDAGIQLGRWGEFRVGGHRSWGNIKPRVGDPGFSRLVFNDSFYLARLDVDTLDRLSFPRYGSFLRVQWTDHQEVLGGDFSFSEFEVKGLAVKSWGEHTVQVASKFQTTINADAGSISGFSLGGFLNLSGLARDQLTGQHVVYGQAVYYRRLTERSLFLDIPVYIGGSVESGNTYDKLNNLTLGSLTWAGSMFVGVDSPLGPVYLAGGITEDGNATAYLFVGQVF